MNNPKYKEGDIISWKFDNTDNVPKQFRGKIFSATIQMIDLVEKHYAVYAEYGQDYIDFNSALANER